MTQDSTDERRRKQMAVIAYDWQSEAMRQNALLHDALTRAEAAEEIGRAFEEDAGQLRAKLAKAMAALDWVVSAKGLTDPTEYGYGAIKHARVVLEEIKGELK